MIYEIVITEQADADLRKIYEYIAFELLSPDHAERQLGRLEKDIAGLEKFPERFMPYRKESWHGRVLRMMPVDNYLVFYVVDKKSGIVTIIRVMYAGRNVEKQLSDHTEM